MANPNIIQGSAVLVKVGDKVIGELTSIKYDGKVTNMGVDKNGIHDTKMEQ